MTERVIEALAIARASFEHRLVAISVDQWAEPTGCTEWNLRDLVNHVIGHQYRYADNLRTNDPTYYFSSRNDDFIGEDPVEAWQRGMPMLDAAIAGLRDLDQVINYRVPLAARDVLTVLVFEATVHTWDVSRAMGFDDTINEQLASLAYPLLARLIEIPAVQAFFEPPAGKLPPAATHAQRLLHLAGRQP